MPLTRARLSSIPSLLAAAGLMTACATTDTFSQLTGERYHRVELNTYPVTIISVDGTHYIERSVPVRIEPGPRRIVVQAPPAAGFNFGEQRTLELDVKPCTRYWIEAKKAGPLAQDFEPRINYSEPISGCGVKKQ